MLTNRRSTFAHLSEKHYYMTVYIYIYTHDIRYRPSRRMHPVVLRCVRWRAIRRRQGLPNRLRWEQNRPREGEGRTRIHPLERRRVDRSIRPGHVVPRRRGTRDPAAVLGRSRGHGPGHDPAYESRRIPAAACLACLTMRNGKG